MLRKLLLSVSAFTVLASVWFVTMDLVLKHPGYFERVWMVFFFAAQAIATIIAFASPSPRLLRALTVPGALIIGYTGLHVFLLAFRGDHNIEGYVLLMCLALVVQATLTLILLVLPAASDRALA
jgi:hypothetical protein